MACSSGGSSTELSGASTPGLDESTARASLNFQIKLRHKPPNRILSLARRVETDTTDSLVGANAALDKDAQKLKQRFDDISAGARVLVGANAALEKDAQKLKQRFDDISAGARAAASLGEQLRTKPAGLPLSEENLRSFVNESVHAAPHWNTECIRPWKADSASSRYGTAVCVTETLAGGLVDDGHVGSRPPTTARRRTVAQRRGFPGLTVRTHDPLELSQSKRTTVAAREPQPLAAPHAVVPAVSPTQDLPPARRRREHAAFEAKSLVSQLRALRDGALQRADGAPPAVVNDRDSLPLGPADRGPADGGADGSRPEAATARCGPNIRSNLSAAVVAQDFQRPFAPYTRPMSCEDDRPTEPPPTDASKTGQPCATQSSQPACTGQPAQQQRHAAVKCRSLVQGTLVCSH